MYMMVTFLLFHDSVNGFDFLYPERHNLISGGLVDFFMGVLFAISILLGCTAAAAVVWPTGPQNWQKKTFDETSVTTQRRSL